MKALTVSALTADLSGVALIDVSAPEPAPGKVLVRMRAAALNFPDLLMMRGAYQLKPPLPFVLGMEMAGEVIAADPASGLSPGDRVVAGSERGRSRRSSRAMRRRCAGSRRVSTSRPPPGSVLRI